MSSGCRIGSKQRWIGHPDDGSKSQTVGQRTKSSSSSPSSYIVTVIIRIHWSIIVSFIVVVVVWITEQCLPKASSTSSTKLHSLTEHNKALLRWAALHCLADRKIIITTNHHPIIIIARSSADRLQMGLLGCRCPRQLQSQQGHSKR